MAVMLAAGAAFAQPGDCPMGGRGDGMGRGGGHGMRGHGGGHGGGGMLLMMADELALTDPQKAEIGQMTEKFGLERIDNEAALDKAELKLRTLKMNDASDNDILKAMDEVGRLRTEMQKMRFKHRQAMHGVLTAEQQEKLKEMRKDRMEKRFDCDGHGRMRDGDGPHGGRGKI